MATFHDRPDSLAGGILQEPHFMCVKGAPDVVIDRCTEALWIGKRASIGDVRQEILDANQKLSEQGLRVLTFAP
jgi:Ca2+-transporting ATPase